MKQVLVFEKQSMKILREYWSFKSGTYSGEKHLQSNRFLEVSKVAKENKKEGKQRD